MSDLALHCGIIWHAMAPS